MKIFKMGILFLLAASIMAACTGTPVGITTKEYVLTTDMRDGRLVFLGVSDEINGQVNPALSADTGQTITVTLINGGMGQHDITFPALKVSTGMVKERGETASVTFTVPNKDASLEYVDSVGNHAALGMKGMLQVGAGTIEVVEATGPTVSYAFETGLQDGKMVFIGKGGEIEGQLNPELKANVGDKVVITLTSGEGAEHDISFEGLGIQSEHVVGPGNSITLEFVASQEGTFAYYCSLPGHRQAGMEGKFVVGSGEGVASASDQNVSASHSNMDSAPAAAPVAGPARTDVVDIVRDPTDVPAPIGDRGPETIRLDLETVEVTGTLSDGVTYTYWTFNGQVPGPMIRVRVGDTIEVHLKNAGSSTMLHSVDFHATTGPGGGAVATQTQPGGETTFTFKAINPGLYVYHCATPMVADHIANGMYGLILVEPEGGLPPVDREFYVMQGEIYTAGAFGEQGHQMSDTTKLLNEDPEYLVFNGAVGGLTAQKPLTANVGETVRIFFGVGGPNATSSFHVIGEIFDRVFDQASLTAAPLTDVQTTLVPPGGATMVEFSLEVPGRYILVDHALSRLQRGLAGFLIVEGEENPQIFHGIPSGDSGH
jgi:nitrite reductase (NO-forming)